MNKMTLLLLITLSAGCGCPALWAFTLTFDDIPAGGNLLQYGEQYGAFFGSNWRATDAAELAWARAHSGTNVATWTGAPGNSTAAWFGYKDKAGEGHPVPVRSVYAYFSTDTDAVVKMTAYADYPWRAVASITIGAPGQSWDNRYAGVFSYRGEIAWIIFDALDPSDARHRFSMDDMTVTLVPEHSSLSTLSLALLAAGAGVKWRRHVT